jgi:uncharacterized protein YodC (DUF2158 family)
MDIEDGAVVTLKSGGPKMTVVKVNENAISCMWFTGETKYEALQAGGFSAASLVVVED